MDIRAVKNFRWCNSIGLFMAMQVDGQYRHVNINTQKGIEILDPISPDCTTYPEVTLSPTEAQVLMDSLWDCGIRPSEGSGSAGALQATQKHLDDMRKIAFSKLEITP